MENIIKLANYFETKLKLVKQSSTKTLDILSPNNNYLDKLVQV